MEDVRTESKTVKLADITPNDYNPQEMAKEKYRGLVAHIRQRGFTDPVKVREKGPQDPQSIQTPYVLVDGEHRVRAYMEVFPDRTEIPVVIMRRADGKPLTREEAVLSTVAYNFQHGEENPIKMAAALKIVIDAGYAMEDIEGITGMKKGRIESFLDFNNIPPTEEAPPPDFTKTETEGGIVSRDPVIISFVVYPEDRQVIESAVTAARGEIAKEVDIAEERGACLLVMAKAYLKDLRSDLGPGKGGEQHPQSES